MVGNIFINHATDIAFWSRVRQSSLPDMSQNLDQDVYTSAIYLIAIKSSSFLVLSSLFSSGAIMLTSREQN